MSPTEAPRAARTVLWDLDGTLVDIRYRTFRFLMQVLAANALRDLVPIRRFPSLFSEILPRVRNNDSDRTNYDHFVQVLVEQTGASAEVVDRRFRRLADREFPRLRRCFSPLPAAQVTVARLAAEGRTQVVATNPLWPTSTVTARLRWAGLDPADFAFVTSGENMRRSKPAVAYYEELVERVGVPAEDCVMIGNDPVNDPPATEMGIPVFLLWAPRRRDRVPPNVGDGVTVGDWPALQAWLGVDAGTVSCSSS